jgi:hypothetical protein
MGLNPLLVGGGTFLLFYGLIISSPFTTALGEFLLAIAVIVWGLNRKKN